MKKLENLGRKLTKAEQKQIAGGNPPVDDGDGGTGACVVNCPNGSYSCTSESGDCKDERTGGTITKIICDGTSYTC